MTKPIEDSANAAAIRTALDVPTNAALNTKYTKPTNGIPASDLEADPAGRVLLTATSAAERKQVLGLDQVDNTSDANKPVSTAQAVALATKMDATMPALQSVVDGGTPAQKAAFQASVSVYGRIGATAQSMALNLAALDAVTRSDVTVAIGPSADANTNTEYSALQSSYPHSVSFLSGTANADAFLVAPGSYWQNPLGKGVSASGEARVTGGPYWSNGYGETSFDGVEVAFVFEVYDAAPKATFWVDGTPVSTDAIALVGSTSWKYRWVTLTLTGAELRRISWAMGGYLREIRWKTSAGYALVKPPGSRRIKITGDSFMAYERQTGEVISFDQTTYVNRFGSRLSRVLGFDLPVMSTRGGTGFLQTTANDGTYRQRLALENGSDDVFFNLVWGSGNDISLGTADIAGYKAEIRAYLDAAALKFPNAFFILTGVVGGYFPSAQATVLSTAIAEVCAERPRQTIFMPLGTYGRSDRGYFYGTGRVNAPAGDGNADVYLGSAGSGSDRHWNVAGIRYAVKRFAPELRARLRALTV